jgi:predicted dehydrogenase
MEAARIGIAQVGFGYWGPNLLRNLAGIAGVEIVAVADTNPRRLGELSRGQPPIATADDYRHVLARSDVDAVVIATPADTHAEIAAAALAANKHVLVEKPLATRVEDARSLCALAERAGRVLMVGHTFLYNAAVRCLKSQIDSGALGDVYYVYAQRLNLGRVRRDVNALWNFAPHDVAIVLYLLDAFPREVSARGFAYLQPDVDDVAFVTMDFPNRQAAHLHISWLDPRKVRQTTVVGSRRMAVYDDLSSDARVVLYDRGVDRVPTVDSPRDFNDFGDFQLRLRSGDITVPALTVPEPLREECRHFIDCIRSGDRPLTDGAHGLRVVEILDAAQRSMQQHGRAVRIGE